MTKSCVGEMRIRVRFYNDDNTSSDSPIRHNEHSRSTNEVKESLPKPEVTNVEQVQGHLSQHQAISTMHGTGATLVHKTHCCPQWVMTMRHTMLKTSQYIMWKPLEACCVQSLHMRTSHPLYHQCNHK